MKLRPYQLRAVRDLRATLTKHRRVVAVSPTGSGKTVIGAAMIAAMRHSRVLWLVHRRELVDQAFDQLLAAGVPAKELGKRTGQARENVDARVLVASVQSYEPGAKWDLIVVDEAHHALAQGYRDALAGAFSVLGLTATPWRLDGSPLGDVFFKLYEVSDFASLIAESHIAAPVCYGVPREKLAALKRIRSGNDYNETELAALMSKRTLIGDLVQHWERLAKGRSTIVYAVNCVHGMKIAKRFRSAGHPVAYLDGETPALLRADILERLASGALQIVVNVNVLSEGFDCAPVKCIVLARPTKSLTMFLQQVGRGSRPHGRQAPIVLDHAGNVNRHGMPTMPREWSLTARPKRRGGDATRHCPECSRECPIGARECEGCGYEFPLSTRELAERDGELERLHVSRAFRERLEVLAKEKIAEPAKREAWIAAVMGAA